MAYFESVFFKISLEICDTFKFIQNIWRVNEPMITKEGGPQQISTDHAGVIFLGQFKQLSNQLLNCSKIMVILHEPLDKEQNVDLVETNILQAFQDYSEDCLLDNNWMDGQVRICLTPDIFCHHSGLDFS